MVNITGAGSKLTLNSAASATIGAASGSTATVNVGNGGTFVTGTGLTTVNATGDLNVNFGGTLNVRGNMTVFGALDIDGTMILGTSGPPPLPSEWFDAENHPLADERVAVPEPSSAVLMLFGLVVIGHLIGRVESGQPSRLWFYL